MVRDLSGPVADADAAVEARGPEPNRATLHALRQHLPQPHVVPVRRAGADRLLEGEVLAASLIHQRAHRRVLIGSVQHDADADLGGALDGDGIGGVPSRGRHGADHLGAGADEADVEGIARNALRRRRHERAGRKSRLVLAVRPQRRQQQVRRRQVERDAAYDDPDCRCQDAPLAAVTR